MLRNFGLKTYLSLFFETIIDNVFKLLNLFPTDAA